MSLSRRNFLRGSAGLVLGTTAVTALFASGCQGSNGYGDSGGSGGGGQTPQSGDGSCAAGNRTVTYQNPGHVHTAINLPKEMVDAAQPGFYTLLSGSHDHDFELTAADFVKIKKGESVVKTETDHGHRISISC